MMTGDELEKIESLRMPKDGEQEETFFFFLWVGEERIEVVRRSVLFAFRGNKS